MQRSSLDVIKSILGDPYYEEKKCLIYNLDSVEAMEQLIAAEEGKQPLFDLTVTSPPYNIGKEYEDVRPLEEYLDWCGRWIHKVHQLTSPAGAFWLNLGYVPVPDKGRAVPLPYLLYDRIPFFLNQEVVWHYGAGVACRKQFSPRNEKFLWYVKDESDYIFNLDDVRDPNVKYPNQKKNGVLRCNPLGKNPSDVWEFPKVTSGQGRSSKERTSHPAQFPVAVIERIVRASSNADDIILDPFIGSGTTAEVAIRTGRTIVGFEIDRDYCEIISHRLRGISAPARLKQRSITFCNRVEDRDGEDEDDSAAQDVKKKRKRD